jgi:hypothetical protein
MVATTGFGCNAGPVLQPERPPRSNVDREFGCIGRVGLPGCCTAVVEGRREAQAPIYYGMKPLDRVVRRRDLK